MVQMKESPTGGTKIMSIMGRMAHERERTSGMNEAERAWRKQWLKDQALSPREPMLINKEHPELMNPLRRAYRWPLNQLQKLLTPVMGANKALVARFYLGKILMGTYIAWGTAYYFMYNTNDWTSKSGWRVTTSKAIVFPGDENFATVPVTQPRDYYDRGFKDSVFGKKYDNARPFKPDDEIVIRFD